MAAVIQMLFFEFQLSFKYSKEIIHLNLSRGLSLINSVE